METKYTDNEIANSFKLWREHMDPDGISTEEEFNAMSMSERMDLIAHCLYPILP